MIQEIKFRFQWYTIYNFPVLHLYFSIDACSNEQINEDTMLPHIFNKKYRIKMFEQAKLEKQKCNIGKLERCYHLNGNLV